jgi:hypothetical protein
VAKGFRVFQLSDRRFRFSVCSNKVGHFIYGLKDRIWPDFVCHFSLYRGDVSLLVAPSEELAWNSTDHLVDIAHRSSISFKSSIQALRDSAGRDPLSSSAELAKFGLDQRAIHSTCNIGSSHVTPAVLRDHVPRQPTSLNFGSLNFEIPKVLPAVKDLTFIGANCGRILCQRLPVSVLQHLEDLRLARYSEMDIMEILKLPFIPPKDLVYEFIGCCSRCSLSDHLRPNCPGVCDQCQFLGFKCPACSNKAQPVKARQQKQERRASIQRLVANFVGIFVTPFGNAIIKGNLSGELKLFPLLEVGHNSKGKKSGWLRLHISLYRYLHIPPLPFRLLHLLLQRKLLTSTSPWLLSPSTLSRSYLMA